MAKEWYLLDSPPVYNGGFEREEFTDYAQQGFQEMLDTTMLCDNVEFINSDFSLVVPGQAIIQNVTSDSNIKVDERQILAPIGTLHKYAYVRFNDEIWILCSQPSNNKFYEKALMKICRNKLRWQDAKTKEIFNYWYWSEDCTRYGSGVFKGNIVVSYEKLYNILLPMDSNTQRLHDGMRFILEFSDTTPLVYKLTKYDGITGNNKDIKLLKLIVSQTVFNPETDNIEKMIADYVSDESQSLDENIKCDIQCTSDCISLASFETFEAVFPDIQSHLDGIKIRWSISDNNFDIENLTLKEIDNFKLKVIVKNNKNLIDEKFKLNVISESGKVLATIPVTIVALW